MPETAIAFPRISREVIESIESDMKERNFDFQARFTREQPVLFDFMGESLPLETSSIMLSAMGFLYEALQRQMRRGL